MTKPATLLSAASYMELLEALRNRDAMFGAPALSQ